MLFWGICCLEEFPVQADLRVKIEYSKKETSDLKLGKELKMLWNMSVTMIPTEISTLETVPKSTEKILKELEIGRRIEII